MVQEKWNLISSYMVSGSKNGVAFENKLFSETKKSRALSFVLTLRLFVPLIIGALADCKLLQVHFLFVARIGGAGGSVGGSLPRLLTLALI